MIGLAKRLELQPLLKGALPHILHLKQRYAMPPGNQLAPQCAKGPDMSRDWRRNDAVMHNLTFSASRAGERFFHNVRGLIYSTGAAN